MSPAETPGFAMPGVSMSRTSGQDTAEAVRPTPTRPGRKVAEQARRNRATRERLRLEAQAQAEETDCWSCGAEVDQSIQGDTHPWGPTVLHVRPAWAGGNPFERANTHLAHRRCKAAYCEQLRTRG